MDNTSYTIFLKKVTELGFGSYEEYLASPHWQGFRKRYFRVKSTKKYCLVCMGHGIVNFEVELHHKTYSTLGKERLYDVIPVCRIHHELIHEILKDKYKGDIRYTTEVLVVLAPKKSHRRKPLHRPDNARTVRNWKRGRGLRGESED